MEVQTFEYDPKDVVETAQGNKIHKQCCAHGSQNIMLSGSSILLKDVIVRGDMAQVKMGKFCVVGERTVIRPSYKEFQKGATYFHSNVGDHVMIEEDCVIEAVQIGSYVHIGAGSVIGNGVIVKDCSIVLPRSVIPPNQIIPPFTVFGGNPAKQIDDAPETTQILMTQATTDYYQQYIAETPDSRKKYDEELRQEIEQLKQLQEEMLLSK
jgi:dynactin-5